VRRRSGVRKVILLTSDLLLLTSRLLPPTYHLLPSKA
jgi:hypothetical protein